MKEKILEAIKKARKKSKRRNFVQTFDLIINLKEFDIKKPENKLNEDLVLPYGRGKDAEIVVFSDTIKDLDVRILRTDDLLKLAEDRRSAKKLIKQVDFFLAEPQLMPKIGKILGQFLGPRGKMPRVITSDPKELIKNYKKSVKIRVKDSPVVQCIVGKENMEDEKIAENIQTVINFLKEKLPKGEKNIKEALIKLTMGPPIKIEVEKW
jgi:large subunit ribosomal protein L1